MPDFGSGYDVSPDDEVEGDGPLSTFDVPVLEIPGLGGELFFGVFWRCLARGVLQKTGKRGSNRGAGPQGGRKRVKEKERKRAKI